MRLHAGILGKGPGWESLLKQEGLPHSTLSAMNESDTSSVIVVTDSCDDREFSGVKKYLANGGAVICSGKIFSLIGGSSRPGFVRYMSGTGEFQACGLIDVYTECHVPANANYFKTHEGQPAVYVGEFGGGIIAVLPFDAGTLMLDRRVTSKSFYGSRRRLPHEVVSLVSKGAIRKLVARALELLHHKRALPYVHTWYFPKNAQSVFALRIDTDFGSDEAIERLYQIAAGANIPFSWFVHIGYRQSLLERFKRMDAHEIGLHCYDHVRYETHDVVGEDLKRGVEALRTAGITATSFASPYGGWNEHVAKAVEHFGFEYSSEFSYDYDDLPSHPVVDDVDRTLQVPIHPVSIGSLRRQGFGEQDMIKYFVDLIHESVNRREPAILYHHPNNGHEGVLKAVIEEVRSLNIPVLRMIDYARWWKKREQVVMDIDVQGTSGKFAMRNRPDDDIVWQHITRADGTECFLPPADSLDLHRLNWISKPAPVQLPDDYLRIRKFNPWIIINHIEDRFART